MSWDSFTIENNNNYRTLCEIFNGVLGVRAKPPENFTVFDHLKHRKRSRRMYENSEKFNSLWEKFFLDFELMGNVFANHPPTPGGVSRSFGRKSKFSHKPDVSTYSFPIRRMFGHIHD